MPKAKGPTGYAATSYGIADVTNSRLRYMGPLHIKVNPEKSGFDASGGGVLNEKLDFTEYYKLTKEKTSCSDFATTNIGGIVLDKTF